MERLRHLHVLTRRAFLGLFAGLIALLAVPPIWARNKLKVIVGRISQLGSVMAPTIQLVQTGTWPAYAEAY